MAVIGYARVSTIGQSLEIQIDKLNAANVSKIFAEKKSGTSTLSRDRLNAALDYVREGDVFVVTKLDRLARSVNDLSTIVQYLHDKGVGLLVLDQAINTESAEGKLMLHMLSAIAEFETDLRATRQAEGILKAKEKGIKFGAPRKLDDDIVTMLKMDAESGAFSKLELAKKYDVSRTTVYRLLANSAA
ncbi:MAG: recombinase family protein [Halopseudomonas sp.]